MTVDALLRAVERIRPTIEGHAEVAEVERRLSEPVYDAMLEAGLFRALAPRAYGGEELHPVDALRIWEAVAHIDSVAGWNLQISSAIAGFAAWLPKEGGDEVYARGPDTIFAGGFFPPGPSVKVDCGWRVTARTQFVSGCQRAQWFGVPIVEVPDDASRYDPRTEDPPRIVAFVPRDEIDVIDTWHTAGMRGTFSADISVDDAFVPDRRIVHLDSETERAPAFAGPLYGLVPWPGVLGEAVVSIGIAAAAVEKLVELALRKKPSYSRIPLHHREMAQHHAGKARGLVDASRTYLHAAAVDAYAVVEREGQLSEDARIRLQLACCFAGEHSAQAVDLVHEAAGSSAFRISHGIERHHRDVHVLTQHATKSYARYEDVGRMLFGMPPTFFILDL